MKSIKKMSRAINDDEVGTGMFVTVADDTARGRVYVVGSLFEEKEVTYPNWREEFISLIYIDDTQRCSITHYHITKLQPFNGNIPQDHPLRLLKKIAIGKVCVKRKLKEKLLAGRILLDYSKSDTSWKKIPELYRSATCDRNVN